MTARSSRHGLQVLVPSRLRETDALAASGGLPAPSRRPLMLPRTGGTHPLRFQFTSPPSDPLYAVERAPLTETAR